jgi:hypothetical protein
MSVIESAKQGAALSKPPNDKQKAVWKAPLLDPLGSALQILHTS